MSDKEEIASVAERLGHELGDTAIEAFEAACKSNGESPPTKRERILIRVLSLQLASAIANVIASP